MGPCIIVVIIIEIMLIWNVLDPVIREWLAYSSLTQQRMTDYKVPGPMIAEYNRHHIRQARASAASVIGWASESASQHWENVLNGLMDFFALFILYLIFQIITAIASVWSRDTPSAVETIFGILILLIIAFSALERIKELGV